MAEKKFVISNLFRSDGKEILDRNIEKWAKEHPIAKIDYIEDKSGVDWSEKIVHYHQKK